MSNDNMALSAAASYADFKNIKNPDELQDVLKEEMPATQAEKFIDTYEILAHKPNKEKSNIL